MEDSKKHNLAARMNSNIVFATLIVVFCFLGNDLIIIASLLSLFLLIKNKLKLNILKPFIVISLFGLAIYAFLFKDFLKFLFMTFRAMNILVVFLIINKELNFKSVREFIQRYCGETFSVIVSISLNIVSFLQNNLKQSFLSAYLRGNFNRPFRNIVYFVTSIFIKCVSIAGHISDSLIIDKKNKRNKIIIVSGPKHSGKTIALFNLADDLTTKGIKVGGILALGYFKNNQRDRFDALDIKTKKWVPLAKRLDKESGFMFYKKGVRFCNKIFKRELKEYNDFVIFDEIGSVELKGKGHSYNLKEFINRSNAHLIVSIREELVEDVIKRFNLERPVLFLYQDYERLLDFCLVISGNKNMPSAGSKKSVENMNTEAFPSSPVTATKAEFDGISLNNKS